jgi:hypothetical protein
MTHDPTRDCEHGRLKGKCDVCDLQAEVERLTELLNNPEEHYPGNFDTPQRANALLTGLCQDAAKEIERLNAEVLEQCRINGMSAEREDALRAELTRLKASIALDKMAENARELGLDYEPAPVQGLPFGVGGGLVAIRTLLSRELCIHANTAIGMIDAILKEHPAAQPAVQEKCFLCGERVASCTSDVCPKSAQPVPVKTYHDGKPWPVAPKPWVGLTDEDKEFIELTGGKSDVLLAELVESKLKEKNT